MPERQQFADDFTRKEEKEGSKPSIKFGKMGKIFLLSGIILIQAVAAYAIIKHYYPELTNLTSKLQSDEGVYYKFKNIIINPAGSGGQRYLVFSLAVELNNGDALNTLKGKKAEAKDRINILISHYTVAELSSLKKRISIKKKLETVINNVIGKRSVRNLYFTKYVLQ